MLSADGNKVGACDELVPVPDVPAAVSSDRGVLRGGGVAVGGAEGSWVPGVAAPLVVLEGVLGGVRVPDSDRDDCRLGALSGVGG